MRIKPSAHILPPPPHASPPCARSRGMAQEVRRAIPVEPPTAPAVPFDFDKPSPTPAPTPTPAPMPVQPVNIVPTPAPETTTGVINAQSPDKDQLNYANSLYAKKMYDMAAPEYEKYVSLYPRTAPTCKRSFPARGVLSRRRQHQCRNLQL